MTFVVIVTVVVWLDYLNQAASEAFFDKDDKEL